jgi:hypothetical protein
MTKLFKSYTTKAAFKISNTSKDIRTLDSHLLPNTTKVVYANLNVAMAPDFTGDR